MKLELEMQELEQVWYGLDGSAKLLDELAKVLNKHQKAEKTSSTVRSLAAPASEALSTQWCAR